jgi:hypothetical protein
LSTAANGLTAPALAGTWSQPGTQAQLAQQSAAASQLPASPMMAPQQGMGALMPNVQAMQQPGQVTPIPNVPTDTFVAPQTGMASLFVPGNPFVAPPMVRPTVVV